MAAPSAPGEHAGVLGAGIVAGLLGGATIAVWFLILDSLGGRPLYTPTLLATAIFGRGDELSSLESLSPSLAMAALFTLVHFGVFALVGIVAATVLRSLSAVPDFGFRVVALLVLLELGFVRVSLIFAPEVLEQLTWPSVFAGNLLATLTMLGYLTRKRGEFATHT